MDDNNDSGRFQAATTARQRDEMEAEGVELPFEAPLISDAEAEQAEFVICGTPDISTPFADNVQTVCVDCGRAVIHRPHAPKRPKKICLECGLARLERAAAH